MPVKKLLIERKADKAISKLPLNIQNRIDGVFEIIRQNPIAGAKLGGELAPFRKYRLGDYRIVYRFDKKTKTVIVVKIEHRRGVYR